MTSGLFPTAFDGSSSPAPAEQSLPMCREVKWDFEKKTPVFVDGNPVIVEGSEAVEVWAWHALQSERYRYEHESWRYGCELNRLLGRSYQKGTVEAEAKRYIVEALLVSPYITAAEVTEMEQVDDVLHFAVRYDDVYGRGVTVRV